MQTNSVGLVSINDLRIKFPAIQAKIAAGQSFILLNRSKPVAKIVPLDKKEPISFLDFWSNPPEQYLIKNKKLNAVKLVREDRED